MRISQREKLLIDPNDERYQDKREVYIKRLNIQWVYYYTLS